MQRTQAVIIGGGQAGLAMSRCLLARNVDHVVLERGRIAERWRSSGWDSLRLLSPNWQSRLPDWRYQGSDLDGYMTKDAVIGFFEAYAADFSAPVETGAAVQSVEPNGDGYRIRTDRGDWQAPVVVVATGHCQKPLVPDMAAALSPAIHQLTAPGYRNPEQLPAGGVLIVGGSSSGVQLAEEIQRSGHPVTLSVGRHIRLPRRYRERDIMWWLDRIGLLNEKIDEVADPDASRAQPSLQLVGRSDGRSIDLAALRALGVRIAGRTTAMQGTSVRFSETLAEQVESADRRLDRLLDRIDAYAEHTGLFVRASAPERPEPISINGAPTYVDLASDGIRTVIWATGYSRHYPWLKVPVIDRNGEIVHRGGVTQARGLYALGLRWLRRRNSSFIDGVGADAYELADEIVSLLRMTSRLAA